MTTAEFLSRLHSLDVRIWAEAGRLRCSAPKGVLTPQLQEELRDRKDEILRLLESAGGRGASTPGPIERVARDGGLRLSFGQERLWFLHQLFPENPAYNTLFRVRLDGALDVPAFRRSLEALVDRHEALRTCFPEVDGQPVQVIHDDCRVPLSELDLRHLPEARREIAADEQIEKEVLRPFNLTGGPVIRATLVRMSDQDHILLITIHHIATDGWSRGVIERDLAALYNADVSQRPSALPALRVQYADFAQWQRQRLAGEVLEEQMRYWRAHLDGLSNLDLPTDRPRPAVQTHIGASHAFLLPVALTGDLKALSREAGATLATTLLTAFQTLLARYSGQTDIAVGSPIANRTRSELENLVGFFVNTLVMRTDLSGDPTFREALARASEAALGAFEHQDLPFEQLVAELQPERDFSRNPLFQVAFAFQNVPRAAIPFSGLTIKPVRSEASTTRMDLECFVWECEEGLRVTLVFNTALFERETIERLGGHYRKLLAEVVADPTQRLSQISLLAEAERQRLLVAWNSTETAFPRDATLAERFEAQAAATPDAIALVFGEQQLTYGELSTRANQLAWYLRQKHGVGPEVCVGLCMDRGVQLIVGLLGIVKAGGVYLPLDHDTPPARLAFMLKDAGVALALTEESSRDRLPTGWTGAVIAMDTDWASISESPASDLRTDVTAGNLAYIMYTSGSTGQPKGIGIPQRAVIRLVVETDYIELDGSDRVAQVATASFDAATFEIWGALLNGSRLVIIQKEVALSTEHFAKHLQDFGVTVLLLTTALFNQMARARPDAFQGMSHMLFGGETVDPQCVREVLQSAPPRRLLHIYGPTESTTFASWHLTESVAEAATTVPIGRPVANTRMYVLDRAMQPVPVGVYGELFLGGDGLARSYLRRPALTAQQFVPDPFSEVPGSRLYRTGDIVRYLPDGTLEFLGRRDHQVKLRGYRIELGEIEAVLAQHPGVRVCVAMVREDAPGDRRLVAYLVPTAETLAVADVRRHLQERLPAYMVPSHLVALDALPLTPNGKVDRKKLPVPDEGRTQLENAFVAARTPTEKQLEKIWLGVLGLDQVGVEDNFFELGGHSLMATQVVSRVRDEFQVQLPLVRMFQRPTIASLAELIETIGITDRGHPAHDDETAGAIEEGEL